VLQGNVDQRKMCSPRRDKPAQSSTDLTAGAVAALHCEQTMMRFAAE